MTARPRSLKAVLSTSTVVLTILALAVAAVLVVVTSVLHHTTIVLGAATESIRLVEEAQIDLLLHERAENTLVKRDLEGALRRKLLDARRFVSGAEERRLLEEATERVTDYIGAVRARGRGSVAVAELNFAYGALQDVVNINVTQARMEQQRAARLDALANIVGVVFSISLVIGALTLVYWVRVVAFRPVFELSQVMDRFGDGDRAARAAETGPVELRAMAERFNEMASAIDRQRDRQLASLAGIAHDLRTPLAALASAAAAIRPDQPLPPEPQARALLEIVARQITRINRLTGDLLDAARIEAGQLELRIDEMDVREIVGNAVDLFRDGSARHAITVRVPDDPLLIHADALRIEQVLVNLLSNAMKYSPAGGEITMRAEQVPGGVLISVSDQGLGIPAEDQHHVFEPFRRVGLTQGNIPGIGLGLYVVRRIVEAHGGRMSLESAVGKGSVFRIHLPQVAEPSGGTF